MTWFRDSWKGSCSVHQQWYSLYNRPWGTANVCVNVTIFQKFTPQHSLCWMASGCVLFAQFQCQWVQHWSCKWSLSPGFPLSLFPVVPGKGTTWERGPLERAGHQVWSWRIQLDIKFCMVSSLVSTLPWGRLHVRLARLLFLKSFEPSLPRTGQIQACCSFSPLMMAFV